jgi:hypothetical protein
LVGKKVTDDVRACRDLDWARHSSRAAAYAAQVTHSLAST